MYPSIGISVGSAALEGLTNVIKRQTDKQTHRQDHAVLSVAIG